MDRDKVTKATAQIGFIKFVLIPMFETVTKVNDHLRKLVTQQGEIHVCIHMDTHTHTHRHALTWTHTKGHTQTHDIHSHHTHTHSHGHTLTQAHGHTQRLTLP